VKKNGDTYFLEQLSDGERGLLALVFDLTRRLAIANPESDNPIAEGVALVLIDEIELHLHPKWQRQVVRKLQEVFKNCQFVITTHSPQIIGQIKAEKLRLLSHDESGKVVLNSVAQTFGMDSSWVLQNIMGVPSRDYETEQKLSKVYDEIDAGDYKTARIQAEKLRSEIGDFPDLQEALALLDRFEMLGQG
jgi:predicted ATP-binding protein involved in virulence